MLVWLAQARQGAIKSRCCAVSLSRRSGPVSGGSLMATPGRSLTRTGSSPTSTASSAWGLKAAQQRGDWDDTKALMAHRPGRDHRAGQGIGAARPRRRGLPDRHEVELHAQGAQARPAQFPGHQRRRIRARLVQGPRDHPPRSAQADRRRADRRLRDARARRLHLHPRRVHPRNRGARGAVAEGL